MSEELEAGDKVERSNSQMALPHAVSKDGSIVPNPCSLASQKVHQHIES